MENGIWIGKELALDEEVSKDVKNNFGAQVSKTDFETTEAVNKVNKWTAFGRYTNVLANTLYLNSFK